MIRRVSLIVALPLLITALSIQAAGAETDDGEWQWFATPYLWVADMEVDLKLEDGQSVGGKIKFKDMLDKTDAGGHVHAECRRGRWGMFIDFTFFDTSDDDTIDGIRVATDEETIFLELAATYHPLGADGRYNLFFGIRQIALDQEFKFTDPGGATLRVSDDDRFTDAMIGARYRTTLTDKWLFEARGDVSAGDTDLTWNTQALFGYPFGKKGNKILLIGYRHREIELDIGAAEVELTMSGPTVGVHFDF